MLQICTDCSQMHTAFNSYDALLSVPLNADGIATVLANDCNDMSPQLMLVGRMMIRRRRATTTRTRGDESCRHSSGFSNHSHSRTCRRELEKKARPGVKEIAVIGPEMLKNC